jgi:hypothetical protein
MTIKERPILFSGPMVRALLDGSKTQTRRVIKPKQQPDGVVPGTDRPFWLQVKHGPEVPYPCTPGDRLWVRETWSIECLGRIGTPEGYDCSYELEYRADGATREFDCPPGTDDSAYLRAYDRMRGDWWPSIHMPRWASRITLEVTGVRVERLDDISEADARAEGVTIEDRHMNGYCAGEARPPSIRAFRDLWESINGAESWTINPWVWVVEFKRVT